MTDRRATVLVCDDVLVSLAGKLTARGIYTADLAVASDETLLTQLVFLFHLECDLDDPFKSIVLEVQFPGEATPRQLPVKFAIPHIEGRKRWVLRYPFLLQLIKVRPGRISTKVIHDKGEIDTGGIWVIKSDFSLPVSH
jgi:hypothetical protein